LLVTYSLQNFVFHVENKLLILSEPHGGAVMLFISYRLWPWKGPHSSEPYSNLQTIVLTARRAGATRAHPRRKSKTRKCLFSPASLPAQHVVCMVWLKQWVIYSTLGQGGAVIIAKTNNQHFLMPFCELEKLWLLGGRPLIRLEAHSVTQLRWKLKGSARRSLVITNQAVGWLDRAHNFNLSARESSAPLQETASRSNFLPRVRIAAVPLRLS
jgi:hypothetical protein